MITEEMRGVIVAAGIGPDATKVNQLTPAIQALALAQANAAVAAATVSNTFNAQIGGLNVTVKYTVIGGKLVILTIPPTVGNMQGGPSLLLNGLPAGLFPVTQKTISASSYWTDAGATVTIPVYLLIAPSGTPNFNKAGTAWNGGAGTGPSQGLSLAYSLD